MFVDLTKLTLCAGKGGNGVVAWIRKKYVPKGGPSGGDAGKGGDVYFRVDSNMRSLETYARRKKLVAQNGGDGGSSSKTGKNGQDLVITVPCGTVIRCAQSKEVLADLLAEGDDHLFLKGGKGGYGNEHFKSPTQRAPCFCTQGKPGQSADIILELRSIADVGLVGFPNAGKSSFIKAVSGARVKTASYPFTTLSPNLATILRDGKHLTIADIPGIIHDAHKNKGLGMEFLRHIARCSLLCYVIDVAGVDGRDPFEDYLALRHELECYDPSLLKRKQVILVNKCDLVDETNEKLAMFKDMQDIPVYSISSAPAAEHTKEQLKAQLAPVTNTLFDMVNPQT